RNWRVVPLDLAASLSADLNAIWAAAPDDAWAVGSSFDGLWYRPLVEHGVGGRWSSVPTPRIPGYDGRLMAVDGRAGGELWAVGSAAGGGGPQRVLIFRRCASSLPYRPDATPRTARPLRIARAGLVGEHSNRVGGQMDAHRRSLLPGRVSAAILRPRLQGLAMREVNDDLDGGAHVEHALDHARGPVVAGGSVILEVDALGTDDDSDPPSRADVAAGGHELEVAQVYPSSAIPQRRHHVGHPEEVGDVRGGGLLVDFGRPADLLDLAV